MDTLPPAMQALVDELRADRAAQRRQLELQSRMLEKLHDEVSNLTKMLRRRETQNKCLERENRRLRSKLGLPELDPEPEPDPPPSKAPVPSGSESSSKPAGKKPRKRSRGGRRPPPDHLPENRERHEVCACGHCGGHVWRKDIETTRIYTAVQSYIRCRVIERERVVCTDCGSCTTAAMPPMPVQRALYDCAFLAWLVTMKFAMLVPLDRLRLELASKGIDIAMGTLVHLIERAAKLAKAVDDVHWAQLKAGLHIGFDGTGLKTLVPGQSTAWPGYLEVYTRGDLSVFRYDVTKHADGLASRLDGYDGTLLCDAESRNLAGIAGAPVAHCWAHPLRKLRDAASSCPQRAPEVMAFIGSLYDNEEDARALGLSGTDLVAFRRRHQQPVLDKLMAWLDAHEARGHPPSDAVTKVANYLRNHWVGLTRFVDQADLPLDNNGSEREFQRHAKLRSASLFAGSVAGAHRWAILLGVVRTAQKHNVDVQAYLTCLFEHLGTHREQLGKQPEELTPAAWKAQHQRRAA